jgi:hypothetical protein
MAPKGQLTAKCRRCLENLAVAGTSTAAELDLLDPTAPAHKQTLKAAQQSGYVVAAPTLLRSDPARYSLTAKARTLLCMLDAAPPPAKPKAKRYATARHSTVTPSITYGPAMMERMKSPCADMLAPATRHGAELALQIPSRVNDVLHYRDGRVAPVTFSTTH